jgi:hypothetical protein
MTQATAEFSLFFKSLDGKLIGASGVHVDDLLQIGTLDFRRQAIAKLGAVFDVKNPETTPFTFTGLEISRKNNGSIAVDQCNYIAALDQLPLTASWVEFRSERQNLYWVCHTRPDIACAVSFAQQFTEETYGSDTIKSFKRIFVHLRRTLDVALLFPVLDSHSLRVVAYADASFHNCNDNASQLENVIVLSDDSDTCAIVHFSSHKSKRVTGSTMAAKTLVFVDAFDNAFIIRHELTGMLSKDVPLLMMTESKALFDVITRARYTPEITLMVDVAAAREAYNDRSMVNIGLIRSRHNPADGLTKVAPNDAFLSLLMSSKVDHPIEQFVVEKIPTAQVDT